MKKILGSFFGLLVLFSIFIILDNTFPNHKILTWVKTLVDLLKAFSWPIIALIAIASVKDPLFDYIKTNDLNVEYKDIKVKFSNKREANKDIEKLKQDLNIDDSNKSTSDHNLKIEENENKLDSTNDKFLVKSNFVGGVILTFEKLLDDLVELIDEFDQSKIVKQKSLSNFSMNKSGINKNYNQMSNILTVNSAMSTIYNDFNRQFLVIRKIRNTVAHGGTDIVDISLASYQEMCDKFFQEIKSYTEENI